MQKDEEFASGSKNVKVYVRILPLLERCENCAKISHDKKTIHVRCLQDMKQEKKLQSKDSLYCNFVTDGIFYYSAQEDIYRETTSGIIDNVLGGANFVLITCGQTGTGKSFTTGGLRNNWEHRGLVPRLVSDLIIEKERRKRTNRIHYSLSFVEYRGKKFKDLLNPTFEISYNAKTQDIVKGISRVPLEDEKGALKYIFQCEGRRAITKTSEYPVCHVGTSVITFHIRNKSLVESSAVVSTATIHIVEMAGIDNTRNFRCPKPLRDIISANSLKLEVEQYFENFGRIERIPSPYARSSCLLKYLGDAINFKSIIRFIAHVRVTTEDLDVTLSTLRFAGKMAKSPVIKVPFSVRPRSTTCVVELRDEIERLKRELHINEMFFHQESLMNISSKRAEQIKNNFLDYLNGTISEVELISLSQAKVLTRLMKDFYAKINAEKEQALKDVEKYENTSKNASRISKSSIQGSTKGIKRNASQQKDIPTETDGEVPGESGNDRVGALDDQGITLGPGLSEVPAACVAKVSTLGTRNKCWPHIPSGNKSAEVISEEATTEARKRKHFEDSIRKTFEGLQEMLKRLIEANYTAGSIDKKILKPSTAVPRTMNQRNNKTSIIYHR